MQSEREREAKYQHNSHSEISNWSPRPSKTLENSKAERKKERNKKMRHGMVVTASVIVTLAAEGF